jgi:hypothetical protein
MSATDFDLELDRLANPKGDRVRLLMSGKFLLTNITPSRACRNTGSKKHARLGQGWVGLMEP